MEKIVLSIAQAVLSQALGRAIAVDDPHMAQTGRTLYARIRRMPVIVMCPMMVLTAAFDVFGLCAAGRLFHHADAAQRSRQITQWKNSPVSLCREFVGFYEKMAAFIYFSLDKENACLNKI